MPPPGRRGHLSVLSPDSLRKRVCAAPGARPEANGVSREFNLVVDRIKCDGRGLCAELLPELIRLDDWGYPILRPGPLPEHSAGTARGRRLSRARHCAPAHRAAQVTTTILAIAEDRALGGSLRIIVTRPRLLAAARAAVDEVVAAIDMAASRFREDSELTRLNATPDRVVKVSPLLARAIEIALRGAELTKGAVDPTVGFAIRLAGYDADFASVPPLGASIRLVANRIPGWRAIRFSPAARTV